MVKTRKKILVITPRYPYPVIGGDRLRIYYICKELAREHDLTLVSLCESQQEMDSVVPNDGVFNNVHRVLLPKWRSYINCLVGLVTGKPLQVAYYQDAGFAQLVNRLTREHDGVLAHLVRTAQYVNNPEKLNVLEYTDAISMNYERVQQTGSKLNFKHLVYSVEQSRLKRYERRIAAKFNASVFVSQYDADYLFSPEQQQALGVTVCSNGVDLDAFEPAYVSDSKQLVFIGNLYSAQNLDAARWFAQEVMGKLRQHGDFTFKVIGKIRDADRAALDRIDGVLTTGIVDSVSAQASGSLAGICSVRIGAGIQNKVLEYMSMELPCISSSIGAEGFDAHHGESILIADSIDDYVDAVLKLSNDSDLAQRLSTNGRNYVESSHSWRAQLEKMCAIFR